ncbi:MULTISPECIES: carbon monoxide dehydrogenase subunit G [Rhizobium/Agrobacterium group]|uniref:Carbon monoxide dehydrogenase subunit G n=2 Tax=Neorhizobium TaxID=1525371 RepID=A0ABV0M313_9HYPH|nr:MULTISPECIES: carbon monoxide dehydrogenase subunit G [Rhizobium/Agrobacterium group]MCC2609487.1 carbon monoxide dehydrogenase subunit G [Neorhizobium petrolearium]WGI69695.1 carbon monoxide dehydrogenase subunit G [Neorhizobium petrolearium]
MEFVGEHVIPAPIDKVWVGLNDPETLRRSIPGCSEMLQTGDREFTASVVAKVGPVSATFKGKVELSDLDPPFGYILSGRGQGGPAGFAKGSARIRLTPQGDRTLLAYVADVDIGGKLASVGGRLIQSIAKKNAEDFFSSFSAVLSGGTGQTGEQPNGSSDGHEHSPPGPTSATAHIPLIDRIAWLLVGMAIGVAGTLVSGVMQ